VSTRNITFSLPADLIRQAKIYAAAHDTTVNALVRELLDQKLATEDNIRSAAARFLEIAKSGAHSSVDPTSIHREELYERR
jgi:plasmid stability protein